MDESKSTLKRQAVQRGGTSEGLADLVESLRYPTLADAAKAAIDVQDACNASGVALGMFEAAKTIRQAARDSTNYDPRTGGVNRHPIMQLFAYKLNSLCCMENINDPTYHPALLACQKLVEEGGLRV